MLTGGAAKGRALLQVPTSGVRPTSARVREAMFSMVGQDLTGLRVLDAYGGSGLLALEAWSRGASVVCVEQNRTAFSTVRQNVQGLGASIETLRGDVLARIRDLGSFDIVLADPPYQRDPQPIVEALAPAATAVLVLELDGSRTTPTAPGLVLDRRRSYGSSDLCVFARSPK